MFEADGAASAERDGGGSIRRRIRRIRRGCCVRTCDSAILALAVTLAVTLVTSASILALRNEAVKGLSVRTVYGAVG